MTDTQDAQTPEQIAQKSDAAMDAGFSAARGTEPSPQVTETKEPPVEAKPEDSAAQAAEPKEEVVDEWAGVPPKVRSEIEALRSSLDPVTKIPDRIRNLEGHIGGLTRLTNDLKAALAQRATTATEAKGQEAPSQEQVEAALMDPAAMKALEDDYPDWAKAFKGLEGAVQTRLSAIEKRIAPPVDASALKTELAGDFDKRIAEAEARAEARAEISAFMALKHGHDWKQRIATPDFEAWYAKQPQDVQALSASGSVTDASKMLALYDAHQKKVAEKAERDKRLERAAQPEGVQVAATVAEDPDEAMNAGFKAVRSG